jgi:hypothetical protein
MGPKNRTLRRRRRLGGRIASTCMTKVGSRTRPPAPKPPTDTNSFCEWTYMDAVPAQADFRAAPRARLARFLLLVAAAAPSFPGGRLLSRVEFGYIRPRSRVIARELRRDGSLTG